MPELKVHYLERGPGEPPRCGARGTRLGLATSAKLDFVTCLNCLQMIAWSHPPHPLARIAEQRLAQVGAPEAT